MAHSNANTTPNQSADTNMIVKDVAEILVGEKKCKIDGHLIANEVCANNNLANQHPPLTLPTPTNPHQTTCTLPTPTLTENQPQVTTSPTTHTNLNINQTSFVINFIPSHNNLSSQNINQTSPPMNPNYS